MKAITTTQLLKEINETFFYNKELGFIRIIENIPKTFKSLNYNIGQRTDGYHLLDNSIHKSDGFFDIEEVEILTTQKRGDLYFDEVNQVFKYQILDLTTEELKARIPQTVSQRQLRTQLVLSGFNLTDINTVINSLPEPDRSVAKIAWDYAVTFERESPLLMSLALMLGLSESDLDDVFIDASKI